MSAGGQDTIRQMVTDKIIAALKDGVAPWQKPWNATAGLPLSMSTRKAYRGINIWLLALTAAEKNYSSPWWGTAKKIAELGGQIRKGNCDKSCRRGNTDCGGNHGQFVIFWKSFEVKDETAPEGKKTIRMLRYYNVFNADQADGLPEKFYPAKSDTVSEPEILAQAQKAVDEFFAAENSPSLGKGGDRAYWVPATDHIQVPADDAYISTGERYSTLFHEMTHSTGHASRCNRDGIANFDHFGSERYGKEELVAEMGCAMLCAMTGVEGVFDNSAAYIGSWLKKIQGDNSLVISAASKAHQAVDYITGIRYEDS